MAVELNQLRDQIDEVDKQMVELLARRLALVEQVGQVKSRYGLPIYAPDREAAMLASRRAEAESKGVPPQLIEDILRRTMRESYASEKDSGFKCLNPELRSVVIIGGNGQLGRLFGRMFKLSGYQVKVLGSQDWDKADELLSDAGLVVVTVPIRSVLSKSCASYRTIAFCAISPQSKPSRLPLCYKCTKVQWLGCTLCLVQTFQAWRSR